MQTVLPEISRTLSEGCGKNGVERKVLNFLYNILKTYPAFSEHGELSSVLQPIRSR